jgi:hypothetical protein
MAVFVIALMLGWLAVSGLCQIPCAISRRLRARDLAGLIPHWPFFAPVPGTCDYYLLYRDELAEGFVDDWREISLCDDRRPWHFVWNPQKRPKKALFDLVTSLMGEVALNRTDAIQLSVPYLALLTYVSSLRRACSTRATQFVLMIRDETRSSPVPTPIFLSGMHPL